MSSEVLDAGLRRIREHVIRHSLPRAIVTFHGGEPLLVGADRLDHMAERVHKCLDDVTEVHLGLQTNGTLFDRRFLQVAIRHEISVGLSLDGPPHHHDKFRIDHQGRGTSLAIQKALELLRDSPQVFGGLLCVISLDIEPQELCDYLCALGAKSVDLLLPHATHDHLPPGVHSSREVIMYGNWMVLFLERWYKSRVEYPDLRFYSSIIRLLLGGKSLVESVGPEIITLVVIESNGEIEAVDSLKNCYEGAASTGLNVFDNSFDDVLSTEPFVSRQLAELALCDICRSCPFVRVCGGGYQPHRYSIANGFLNPSVYCESLQLLISRVASLIREDLALVELSVPTLVNSLADANFTFKTV